MSFCGFMFHTLVAHIFFFPLLLYSCYVEEHQIRVCRVSMKIFNPSIKLKFLCSIFLLKVSQDVPKYATVAGERAELRGLNLEGLRRHGFTVTEVGNNLSFNLTKPLHPLELCLGINWVVGFLLDVTQKFLCLSFPNFTICLFAKSHNLLLTALALISYVGYVEFSCKNSQQMDCDIDELGGCMCQLFRYALYCIIPLSLI